MKRSHRIPTLLAAMTVTLLATAAPALAQDYYSTGDEALGFGVLCCYGIAGLIGLALFVFWIWMLIDLIGRQEYEFPNSTGNSKTIWLVIMLVTWVVGASGIAAVIYYFMVYKKIKRGTMQPPSAGGGFTPPGAGAPPPPSGGAGTPPPPAGGGTPPPPPPAQ